jgi:hypothetical protein
MQQDGSITFERVVHTSSLGTWHIVVAVFLFAGLICAAVWWSCRHSEKDPGTLNLRENRTDDSV